MTNLLAIDSTPQRANVQSELALKSKHKLSAVIMALLTDDLGMFSKNVQNSWVNKHDNRMTA
jgi:hypothetical protein